ncbi:MAG TPA: DUF2207 domain-containing protein [Tepidiformaceae bacterium]
MIRAVKVTGGTALTIVGLAVAYVVCAGIVLFAAAFTTGVITSSSSVTAESGWEITSFASDYTIDADGTLHATERIDANFDVEKHGIFRDLFWRVDCGGPRVPGVEPLNACPDGRRRTYDIHVESVTEGNGSPIPYEVSTVDDARHIKIGDPNQLITGPQSYVIRYTVKGALDSFSDHDEFYWNVTGKWPVDIANFTMQVTLPSGSVADAGCVQGDGVRDSTCHTSTSGPTAAYQSSGTLPPTIQVTVFDSFPKGLVAVPPMTTEHKPTLWDFYRLDAIELGGGLLVAILCVLGLAALWWRGGRDRQYKTIYYLTNDPSEQTRPLFGQDQVVVEFLPPDGLKPAQMGVILDERADPLDVTATIIDLAVRGYIHIEEIDSKSWFGGSKDWRLTKVKEADSELQPYEKELLDDIFAVSGSPVQISELRYQFSSKLIQIQQQLYKDAVVRKWFTKSPDASRGNWAVLGGLAALAGLLITFAFGYFFGRGLLFNALPVAGVAMVPMSRAMPRRTATGSEAFRRVLGFRLYVATAETRRQEFNEQAGIFARYLPYAIVFGCVDKWAKAFSGLDDQVRESTGSWYTGSSPMGTFAVVAFASNLSSFSSGVSSTVSSSRSSSGGGGFSGGGGGGGGGGGSW